MDALLHCHGIKATNLISTLPAFHDVLLSLLILLVLVYRNPDLLSDLYVHTHDGLNRKK